MNRPIVPFAALFAGLSMACSSSAPEVAGSTCSTGPIAQCPTVTVGYDAGTNTTSIVISASDRYSSYSASAVFAGPPTVKTYSESVATADANVVLGQTLNAGGQASHWANIQPRSLNVVNDPFTLKLTSVTAGPSGYIVHEIFSTMLYGVVPTTGSYDETMGF